MVLEAQILHYYLKVFKISIFIFFLYLLISFYILIKKNIIFEDYIEIKEGQKIDNILLSNFKNINYFEKKTFEFLYLINNLLFNKYIHFGDFYVSQNISLYEFYNIVSKPSNVLNKITIIEGWSKYDLMKELKKNFKNTYEINYEEILADTYYFNKNETFNNFIYKLKKYKNDYFKNFQANKLNNNFDTKQLFTIASMIEKEALNNEDKKIIYSVISNRLRKNMRLQIDATVIYAITDGKYKFERKLTLKDLKINHPYNTYKIPSLPPGPISYVGPNTLNIIYENYQSEYLFYFFDNTLNKHIFSKNYEEHKKKLNEYRSKK